MSQNVLVVEDSETDRALLRKILSPDYTVYEAPNGEEALAFLAEGSIPVSAVLLDLVMPVLDGFQTLERMRADGKLSDIPVVVSSVSDERDAAPRAIRLGASDFIAKPYDPVLIRHCLGNAIRLSECAARVRASRFDKLTGLYTREAFFEEADGLIRAREAGYYVLACFDIDNFKLINDQYGTAEGDRILREVGRVCGEDMRKAGGVAARVSGDNFAALYPAKMLETGINFILKMRDKHLTPGDPRAATAFSVGRCAVNDLTLSASALYDRAYIAKQSVKGRYDAHVAYFDEDMRLKLLREQEIVSEMDAALSEGQFEVWYQPQFNHATGALIGAEALVRWRHPVKGVVSPGEFIPVFERNGFIYELDKYVWEKTCASLRRWLDEGHDALPVSVNISRCDALRDDLADVMGALCAKYAVPASLLRLEITESAFSKSEARIIETVRALRARGYTVEIDDFGSGYSSLNTLKDVPADVLKLDMRFLDDNGGSPRGGNILESVVRMAKWLDMSVIAEGVETSEQADFLKSIGCDYVQGYLYARPMPEAEYEALMANPRRQKTLDTLTTVQNLDNNAFWDPKSIDAIIFNSYIGGACVLEYRNGRIELLRANDKYAKVIGSAGMTVDVALRLDWAKHMDKENAAAFKDALRRSIDTGDEMTEEFVFQNLPGCPEKTYLRTTLRVIASAGDRHLVYCTNENITAQRLAEQKEKLVSDQVRAIMDDAGCGITASVIKDNQVRFLMANDQYYEILGFAKAQYEAEVSDIFALIHPEEREMVRRVCQTAYQNEMSTRAVYRVIRRDGAIRWVRAILSATRFSGVTEPVQLCVFTDITAEKEAERSLHKSDEQLHFLNDMAHDLLGHPDSGAGIESALGKLLGYFDGNRAYVFEFDYARQVSDNTYEICAPGVRPEKDNLQQVPLAIMSFWVHAFDERRDVNILDVDALGDDRAEEKRALQKQGIRSLVAVPLWRDGTLIGFLGIDDPREHQKEASRLNAIGDYIAVMLTRRDLTAKIDEERRELLDNLPCGAALYELDGSAIRALYFNRRYQELVARPLNSPQGVSVLDAVHPDDRAQLLAEIRLAQSEGRDASCDLRVRYGADEYRRFRVAGRMLPKENGHNAVYATYTQIEDAPVSYQQMLPVALATMLSSSADLSFVKDRDLRYVCCSRAFANMAHLADPKDVIGKTDYDLIDAEYADKYRAIETEIIERGVARLDYGEKLPLGGDEARYGSTSKYPVLDADGNVIGVYGVTRDVTEAHAAFERLKLLTDSIPGGLASFELTPGGLRLTYANEGFFAFSGLTRAQYMEKAAANPLFLMPPEDADAVRAAVAPLLDGADYAELLYRCRARDGGQRWFNAKCAVSEREKDAASVNIVQFDVTSSKEMEDRLRVREEQFRLAASLSGRTVARYNIKTKVYVNDSPLLLEQGFGREIEGVPRAFIDSGLVAPASVADFLGLYQKIATGASDAAATVSMRVPGGQFRWFQVSATTIFDAEGKPSEAIIVFYDVTEQREKEAVYRRWQLSIQEKPPASYTMFRCNLSRDASFDTASGSLLRIQFDPNVKTFNGRTLEYANAFVCPEDRPAYVAALNSDRLLANYYRGSRVVSLEYREIMPLGQYRWLRVRAEMVEYPDSTDVLAYLMYEDINEEKIEELLTREMAETDPLTGVLNRAAFGKRLEAEITSAKDGALTALFLFDLDGFKLINDSFGHAVGDQALVDMANTLRALLGPNDLLGRLGGDEFLVCLPRLDSRARAEEKAKRICDAIHRSFSMETRLSASLGITICPDDGARFDDLYHKADVALYHVKATGKDHYAFYAEGMKGEAPRAEVIPDKSADAARKRRMLIVDDNQLSTETLTQLFKDDYLIDTADSGDAALIRLRRYGSAISVVLLDLIMPGMDGFAVLHKMREEPAMRLIPVVVVSGSNEYETSLKAIRSGASDFVTKPVNPDLLRLRVQSAISKSENEYLRHQNSNLEKRGAEIARYRAAFAGEGMALIECDPARGAYSYDPLLARRVAAHFDARAPWDILRKDGAASKSDAERVRALVQSGVGATTVSLKTPSGTHRLFRVRVVPRPEDAQPDDCMLLIVTELEDDA